MCGIVAFVDNEKPQIKDQLIKKMKDRIIHRGPDAEKNLKPLSDKSE